MALNVSPVSESGVILKTEEEKVIISGSIDCPDPGKFMEPFLSELHQNIVDQNLKAVKIDITELSFLNSSGIRELVDWVMKLEDLSEDQKYRIAFVCNPEHFWQESSISTIVFLNTELLSKESI